jgi:hypothetical protein
MDNRHRTTELLMLAARQAAKIEAAVYRIAAEQGMTVTIVEEIEIRKDGRLLAEYHYWHEALDWLADFKRVRVGSIWECIDEDSEYFGRLCVVKYYDDNPDFNGDGGIELLYANGVKYSGKVRRFMPGTTHKLRKGAKR